MRRQCQRLDENKFINMKKIYFTKGIFLLFVLTYLSIGCNKNNEVSNIPVNTNYLFSCPQKSTTCPFRTISSQTNEWVWINSGYSPLNENSLVLIDNTQRVLEYRINNKSAFKYKYNTDAQNCSIVNLKEFSSGKDIRNIESFSNDSFLLIKDSIICPDNGCFCVNKKYYNNYSINYLKKIICKNVNIINLCCVCLDDETNIDCSSNFKSIDQYLIDEPLSTLKLGNGNFIVLLAGNQNPGSKIEAICYDKNLKVVWQVDLSSLYTNNYFYQLDNQSNMIESQNGDINIFLGESKNNGLYTDSYLNIHTLNSSGLFVGTKSHLLMKISESYSVNKVHILNNQQICIEVKGSKYGVVLLDKNLNLLSFNNNLYTPLIYNDLIVSSFVDQDNLYKMYTKSGTQEKYFIYKYSGSGQFLSSFELFPVIKGNTFNGQYSRIVKISNKLIQFGSIYDKTSDTYRSFWVLYNINFVQLSSNYSLSGKLSDIATLFSFPNLNTLRIIDGSEKEIYISDYNNNSGMLIQGQWLRKNVYGDYAPNRLRSTFEISDRQIIIGDGWFFGSNMLFYTFKKDDFYKYEICK